MRNSIVFVLHIIIFSTFQLFDFDIDQLLADLNLDEFRDVINSFEPLTNELETFQLRVQELADDPQAFALAESLQMSIENEDYGSAFIANNKYPSYITLCVCVFRR